jgi:hypothetical protein
MMNAMLSAGRLAMDSAAYIKPCKLCSGDRFLSGCTAVQGPYDTIIQQQVAASGTPPRGKAVTHQRTVKQSCTMYPSVTL